jgi:two-component system sensor histidine kinase UhpB
MRDTTMRQAALRRWWVLGLRASLRSRLLFAVCAAAIASAVRIALNPYWGASLPYIFYFPTTLFSALFGGLVPALIGTAIMSTLTAAFVLPPSGLPLIADPLDWVGFVVYIGTDAFVAWIGARHRELWLAAENQTSALQQSEQELRRNLADVTRMHRISTRLLHADEFPQLLDDILAAAIDMTRADMGHLQLLRGEMLEISAQRGFDAPFLGFFASAHHGEAACGAALKSGARVVVEDVRTSPIFVDTPARDVLLAAGALSVQSTPLVSRSGRIVGMLSTHYRCAPKRPSDGDLRILDILARQAADLIEHRVGVETLRAKEAELEQVMNDTSFLLTRCTDELRYRFVSRAYAAMLGRRPEDIVGQSIQAVIGTPAFETIRPHIERVLHGNRVEYEADVPFRGVGLRSLQAIYTPDRDDRGRVVGWIASILDVTERKRAVQTRALLASIVDSSDDPIISTNLDGVITSWNGAAERAFGYHAGEAIGQPISLVAPSEHRDERGDILQRLRAPAPHAREMEPAIATGRTESEGWRVRRDGSRFWTSETITPLRDGDGHVIGFANISRDLTERKAFEDALQRARDSLEVRVRERTAEVQALFQRVVSVQEEERRRIARDIHDQLGQQMTALRISLESIHSGEVMALQAERVERTRRIAEELDRSIDFLTWDLRPAALDHLGVSAALSHLVTGWSERFRIGADLDVPGAESVRLPQEVEANLYRIVQEALHNVVKHAHATHVTVVLKRDQDETVLVIEDNGRGFDYAAGTERSGTEGLGLVSMRERAALAGGQLEIESAPNAGTSIFVRITGDRAWA